MNKCCIKNIRTILLILIIMCICMPKVLADENSMDIIEAGDTFVKTGVAGDEPINSEALKSGASLIYNVLLVIGIATAIIWGIVLGIKFVVGSLEEKADTKKIIIVYVIGCIIIFGAFGIWKLVVNSVGSNLVTIIEEQAKAEIAQQEANKASSTSSGNTSGSSSGNANSGSDSGSTSGSNYSSSASGGSSSGNSGTSSSSSSSSGGTSSKNEEEKEKKNVSTLLNTIGQYSLQIQKDYKAGRYWEYSNGKILLGEKKNYNSFADSLKGQRTTNCARIVFWAFYDMGITTKKDSIYSNANGQLKAKSSTKTQIQKYANIISVNKTPNQLKKEGNLKPGDICLYPAHTNIYIGNGKWYDAGRGSGIGNAYSYKTVLGNAIYRFKTVGPCNSSYVNTKATYIIRLKDQS